MSETAAILSDAVARLFEDHLGEAEARRAAHGEWSTSAWEAVEAMGLPLALLGEEQGGFGVDPLDAFSLVRMAGFRAAALPIGETMLANRILAFAGLPFAVGGAAIAPACDTLALDDSGHLSGSAARVPWSDHVGTLLLEIQNDKGRQVVRLSQGQWRTVSNGTNLAGHPRNTIAIEAAVDMVGPLDRDLHLDLAALRTILIAGALDRVLELTVEHVNGRVQFGRALAKFQAVQQECAQIAGEVAVAGAAADIAADCLGRPSGEARIAIACAKLRAGEAVGLATSLAHQLHGAIGFTAEHRLHLFSTALWAWREEYGGHAHWATIVGEQALAGGAEGFWPMVTRA